MATLREIKKRAKSVKNISQITNAMQMVAASKMRKAQQKTQKFEPYAEKIAALTKELSTGIDKESHNLLKTGAPEGRKLFILISTDKGLCGALNSNLFRQINKWYPDSKDADYVTIGKKGSSFVRGISANIEADFSGSSPFAVISAVSSFAVGGFLKGEFSSIEVIFNRFINSFEQKPTKIQLLPITDMISGNKDTESKSKDIDIKADFKIEPSSKSVLNALLPEYIENIILDAALSAEASEFSARMMAMKNATDNAKSLEFDLTLEYNKLRQSAVTSSIQDIVTARMAME